MWMCNGGGISAHGMMEFVLIILKIDRDITKIKKTFPGQVGVNWII